MALRVSDHEKYRCDFHGGEIGKREIYELGEIDPQIRKGIINAGYRVVCMTCAGDLIDAITFRRADSFYACPFLRELEADTNVAISVIDIAFRCTKRKLPAAEMTMRILGYRPPKTRLDVLRLVTAMATDSFADKRRKMMQSILLQGLQRPLSAKQRQVIHWTLNMVGEDI